MQEKTEINNELLKAWSDGYQYRNYVYDYDKETLREITETEYLIVEYCFQFSHHLNDACARLGYNKFEREIYSSKDLKNAGIAIYEYEINRKDYKGKLTKRLVERLPKYLNG